MIRIISATRETHDRFSTHTALGRSLSRVRGAQFDLRLFCENTFGLPYVYNEAIRESASMPATLVFIHDDVEIIDYFWANHIEQGLRIFDLIGLAGNKRRVPNQPAWGFTDLTFSKDNQLSGTIGHEDEYGKYCNYFGPSFARVKLLDGVMLACHSETLWDEGINFDDRFDFHFYDLDFCRQFEQNGLSIGTWGISMVHGSRGSFGSPGWLENHGKYLAKWGS